MKKFIIVAFILLVASFSQIHANEASESAETDVIREKVQEKISAARNKPKANMGVITDKTDLTIQIKDGKGEIQQILTNDDTQYVKINGSSTKLNYEDVAIGDYIIAMGYKNGTSVLESSRILISSIEPETSKVSLWGKVSFNDDEMLLTANDNTNYIIEVVKGAKYYYYSENENSKIRYSEINENDTVIIMGKKEDDVVNASLIQIVKRDEESETEISE